MNTFDPKLEAGHYIAPQGLYERNKNRPFLGSLTANRREIVAGEWTELVLTYEVGASGLADGAWLKLAFKFYSDWALFQTSQPAANGKSSMVSIARPATASTGAIFRNSP